MTSIIIIALVVVLLAWGVGMQNKFVKLDEYCKNALKQINIQQISRYDALKALVKLTRDYASYESETLEKLVSARKLTSAPAPTVEQVNANQSALNELAGRLIAVSERYPELKANEQYRKTMGSVKEYEENVRFSRMSFNDTVTKYNKQVRMFPGSFVAGMLGFATREYLAEDAAKTEYPEI